MNGKTERTGELLHYDVLPSRIENKKNFSTGLPCIVFYSDRHNPDTNNMPLHWHTQIELWLIIDGSSEIILNDIAIPVRKGNIVVINSNTRHSMKPSQDGWSKICLILEQSYLESVEPAVGSMRFEDCFDDTYAAGLLREIFDEFTAKEFGYKSKVISDILALLVQLMRKHTIQQPQPLLLKLKSSPVILTSRVAEYIQKNYHTPISLDEIAEANNLSKCYMCRIFKNITGETVLSFLNDLRCSYADYLIHTQSYTIKEIALKCGFESASYFSRVYKKTRGNSPSSLRHEK